MYSRLNIIVNELNFIGLTKLDDADTLRKIISILSHAKLANIITMLENMENMSNLTSTIIIRVQQTPYFSRSASCRLQRLQLVLLGFTQTQTEESGPPAALQAHVEGNHPPLREIKGRSQRIISFKLLFLSNLDHGLKIPLLPLTSGSSGHISYLSLSPSFNIYPLFIESSYLFIQVSNHWFWNRIRYLRHGADGQVLEQD